MTSKEALTKLLECDEQLKVLEMFKHVCEIEMTSSAKQAAKLKKQVMKTFESMDIITKDLIHDWLKAALAKSETHK